MQKVLTDRQRVNLAKLLIMMEIEKEVRLEVLTVIETPEELLVFLDKLAAKNYEMTSEEVYRALCETLEETTQMYYGPEDE